MEKAKLEIRETVDDLELDENCKNELLRVLNKFPAAFRDEVGKCNMYEDRFKIKGLEKLRVRNRPMAKEVHDGVAEVIERWRKNKLIVPSDSPYRIPLTPVKKKNGKWRPCGDFRLLNKYMEMHGNEVSRIADVKTTFSGKRYFTTLDFRESFLQIPLHADSQPYCCSIFDGVPYQ